MMTAKKIVHSTDHHVQEATTTKLAHLLMETTSDHHLHRRAHDLHRRALNPLLQKRTKVRLRTDLQEGNSPGPLGSNKNNLN